MERYRDQIHLSGYAAMDRRYGGVKSMYHIAHHDRGRGCRMYLCGCAKSIRVRSQDRYIYPGRCIKQTNFQRRSKYTTWHTKKQGSEAKG